MSNDPSKQMPAVAAMCEDIGLIDDLLGGTKAMRAAGVKHLPKFPKEDEEAYKARLAQSTLLPATGQTVSSMTGRVFADPIIIGEDVPPAIAGLAEDIDLQGNNLQVWAADWFSRGLAHGLVHALIEFPRVEGIKTQADERRLGVRPYVVTVSQKQVLGWKATRGVLTQFRYMESVVEDDGEFGERQVDQVRVLEPRAWATYRKNAAGVWLLHEQGASTLSVIPLVTFYTKRAGYMQAVPPLLDLAYLNIKHWQSQSDQDNILHVARVPILFLAGWDDEKAVAWGAGTALRNDNVDAKASFVEHTGASIEAGRTSLQDLVEEMRMAGAKLLIKDKQAVKTAAQANEEAAHELSPLQRMAADFEDAIDQVLQLMAMWMGLGEGGHVEVQGNFEADFAPEVSLPYLLSMANAGKISNETLFKESQRRGVISDEIEWDDEQERIANQGPDLSDLPPLPPVKADPADELLRRELAANGG